MRYFNYMQPRQQDIVERIGNLKEEARREASNENPDRNRIAKIKMEEMLQAMKMDPLYGKNSLRPW